MKVVLSEFAGFCPGVKRALNRIHEENKTNNIVYIFGSIIHNEHVIDELSKKGIITLYNFNDIKNAPSGKLIIRTHGLSPHIEKLLHETQHTIIDLTCPKVKAIQSKIIEYTKKNYGIIIFGKKGHPEVNGLLGCGLNNTILISDIYDIKKIQNNAIKDFSKWILLSQTTQSLEKFKLISKEITNNFENIKIIDTICNTSRKRQDDIKELAKIVDAIIIIGSKESSNTKQMVITAEKLKKPTFFISNIDEINLENLKTYKSIGVSGGASTPNELLIDAVNKIENLSN